MPQFPDLLDDLKPYRIHDRLQERGLRTVPWSHVLDEAAGMTAEERNAGRPPLIPYSREELEAMEQQDRRSDKSFAQLLSRSPIVDRTVVQMKAKAFVAHPREPAPPWMFPSESESAAYAKRLTEAQACPTRQPAKPKPAKTRPPSRTGPTLSAPPSREVATDVLEHVLALVWTPLKAFRRTATPALHVVWVDDPDVGPGIRCRFGDDGSQVARPDDILIHAASSQDGSCQVVATQVPDGDWPDIWSIWSGDRLPWYRDVEATPDYLAYLGEALVHHVGQLYLSVLQSSKAG